MACKAFSSSTTTDIMMMIEIFSKTPNGEYYSGQIEEAAVNPTIMVGDDAYDSNNFSIVVARD
jgi:hypothetical protein